jgi:hypothetical protein
MKKLAIVFLCLVILANSFNFSYIFITTWFYNESIISEFIVSEIYGENQSKILNMDSIPKIKNVETDNGIKLVKMDEVTKIRYLGKEHKYYYEMSILNGGYIMKMPVRILLENEEYMYILYINPFAKKIVGVSP